MTLLIQGNELLITGIAGVPPALSAKREKGFRD